MEFLDAVVDMVFPRRCSGCGAPVGSKPGHVCWDCRSRFQIVQPPFCRLCGDPADGRVEHEYLCHACDRETPHFEMARSAARYRGPLQRILQRFKYSDGTFLETDLVALLEACVRTHFEVGEIDAVAFVPLHAARERDRTYNQSRLLAKGLAGRIGKPVGWQCLARIRPTATQTNLSADERAKNIGGAFAPREPAWLEGRRILLVDDVMTTGATVNECAGALKSGGAARVFVVTVARG